jgi:UPF0755 protein
MNRQGRSRGWFFLALMASLALWGGVTWYQQGLRQPLAIAGELALEVPRGGSLGQVVRELGREGVIERPGVLLAYARLHGRGGQIHAGEYLIAPGTTSLELLGILESGRVRLFSVTLVEGWTLAQARAALARAPRLRQTLQDVPAAQLLAELQIDDAPAAAPEGLFFPDTYTFTGQTADRDILLQAYRRMQEVLAREWSLRREGLPYKNAYEALIMASIVEKETGVPEERPDIAGVFVRRLQKAMLLQTDPTVIYGLGTGFDGNLRRLHLGDAGNPYNTYAHAGLPPTPIALPGEAAIRAALQPRDGDALYFVARGDGSHYFSATLDEHQRAVQKYQVQQRRGDYRSRSAQPAQ